MEIKEIVDKARKLENSGTFHDAYKQYEAGLDKFPEKFALLMGAGRTAHRLHDPDLSIHYFDRARLADPDKPQPYFWIATVQFNTDLDGAKKTIDEGIERFPEDKTLKNMRKRLHFVSNDVTISREFDLEAELNDPQYDEGVLMSVLLKRVGDLPDLKIAEYLGRAAELYPSDAAKRRHAFALIDARKYHSALRVFSSLRNDRHPEVAMGKAICSGASGQVKAAKFFLEGYADTGTDDFNMVVACSEFLDRSPDLQLAIETVADVNRKYAYAGLDNLLEFAAAIRAPRRAPLKGMLKDQDFRLSESGEHGAVVLAFAGFAFKTGLIPFSLIDRYFAGHGIATASLIDRWGCVFWNGVGGLGLTFEETVSTLQSRLSEAGLDNVYTLGNSGGGSAAMVYGCALNARRAVSFSGAGDLRKSFLSNIGDRRGQVVIHALNKSLEDDQLYVKGWLETRAQRCPIRHYYCSAEEGDAAQARVLAELDGIEIVPVERYAEHESIACATGTGQLLAEFETIVEEVRRG